MAACAVVGCKGMLGQEVVRQLRAAGRETALLDLPELDITAPVSVRTCDALRDAQTVFNCAAYTDVDKAEDQPELAMAVNGDGVRNLALLCRDRGSLLVHVSTDYVFRDSGRDTERAPFTPDAERGPISSYGRSKLAGERALEEIQARSLLVRTAWLFGHGGGNFVETMLRLARTQGRLEVVCDQIGSPTCTIDLARALIDLALGPAAPQHAGPPVVFHSVNSGPASWHQFACEIVKQAGLAVPVAAITMEEARARFGLKAKRPVFSVLDSASLETALRRAMRPWQEALAEYLAGRGRGGG